ARGSLFLGKRTKRGARKKRGEWPYRRSSAWETPVKTRIEKARIVPPSMRFRVKPHQAFWSFSLVGRGPSTSTVPCRPARVSFLPLFPSILPPPPLAPFIAKGASGGGERMLFLLPGTRRHTVERSQMPSRRLACRAAPTRRAGTTVYPWGTGQGPRHLLPC